MRLQIIPTRACDNVVRLAARKSVSSLRNGENGVTAVASRGHHTTIGGDNPAATTNLRSLRTATWCAMLPCLVPAWLDGWPSLFGPPSRLDRHGRSSPHCGNSAVPRCRPVPASRSQWQNMLPKWLDRNSVVQSRQPRRNCAEVLPKRREHILRVGRGRRHGSVGFVGSSLALAAKIHRQNRRPNWLVRHGSRAIPRKWHLQNLQNRF